MNLAYNPTQPEERQKDVYGTDNATRKVRNQWIKHAARVIRSGYPPEIEQAYYELAILNGLREELARAILIEDIRAS